MLSIVCIYYKQKLFDMSVSQNSSERETIISKYEKKPLLFYQIMPACERFDKLRREEPGSFLQQEEVGLWSLLFFDWMSETFKTGTSRQLEQSDLLPIEKQNRTKALSEKFQQLWNDEQNACVKSGKQPRLWRCVVKMLRKEEILIITIFSMVHKIGSTLRCLLLGFILYDLISNTGDKTMTYTCAVLLGVVSMAERFASHSQRWMSEVFGTRICCALKGIVYSKVRISWLRNISVHQQILRSESRR